MKCEICGKSKSNRGNLFTEETIKQHVMDVHIKNPNWQQGDPAFEETCLFADDDMPDGAYFALAWEIGDRLLCG